MTHKIDSGTINFGLSHPEVSLHFWLLWPIVWPVSILEEIFVVIVKPGKFETLRLLFDFYDTAVIR